MYGNTRNISALIGRKIVNVTGAETSSNEIRFYCEDGTAWKMLHHSDCCESVYVEDIIGDPADLIGEVLDAREEVSPDDPAGYNYVNEYGSAYRDSFTWTFYIIQTSKGAVTIRWYGTSNGYYSESVDFEEVE